MKAKMYVMERKYPSFMSGKLFTGPRVALQFQRLFSDQHYPPRFFTNSKEAPPSFPVHETHKEPIGEPPRTENHIESVGNNLNYDNQTQTGSTGSSFVGRAYFIAIVALSYLAYDNFNYNVKVEKLNNELTTMKKALQVQQANFLNVRRNKDLQMIEERKDHEKKSFRMALHIALLRKQLAELGVDPIGIDSAMQEFEKSVKVDNSIKNISGQSLWLEDDSRMYLFIDTVLKN